jgi:hypothetical protein
MSREIPDTKKRGTAGFRKITESFFTGKGLPFDTLLSEEKIVDIFSKHNNLFAANGICSTAVVLWAFLGQALRDGKEASCIGFPIARAVAIVSLATAAVMNVAIRPYAGKETGENALLRTLLSTLKPNHPAVLDRYDCIG